MARADATTVKFSHCTLMVAVFRCSYRFPHLFVDQESVCEMQDRVEAIIGEAVSSSTFGAYITRTQRPRQPRRRFNDEVLAKWFRYHKF